MMYQKKSNRWLMLKALFIIPVACFALYTFANPKADSPIPQVKKTAVTQQKKTVAAQAKKVGLLNALKWIMISILSSAASTLLLHQFLK